MQYSQCLCMLTPRQIPPHLECSASSSSRLFNFFGSFSHAFNITGCSVSASLAVEALRPLCLRRAYSFYFQLQTSMLIHLSIPLRVVFLHWMKLGDSSSPLAITQSLFESFGRNHQWFPAVRLRGATLALRS
jgi:hypothetical protein